MKKCDCYIVKYFFIVLIIFYFWNLNYTLAHLPVSHRSWTFCVVPAILFSFFPSTLCFDIDDFYCPKFKFFDFFLLLDRIYWKIPWQEFLHLWYYIFWASVKMVYFCVCVFPFLYLSFLFIDLFCSHFTLNVLITVI